MTDDQSGQTPPVVNQKKPWYKRKWVWAVAILVIIIAAIPTSEETESADEAATVETAEATTEQEPAEEAPPEPEPEPVPEPEPITFSGRGDHATEAFELESGLVRLQAEHQGSSNFAVKLLDGSGGLQELPVNEIGSYSGSRAFSVRSGTYLLDITASGPWTIEITQ